MGTRKQRFRKKFMLINRKRLNKKLKNTGSIECEHVRKEWNDKTSVKINMKDMGLAFDPNVTIGMPKSTIKSLLPDAEQVTPTKTLPRKAHVIQALEEDAKAPRVRQFRLPKGHVEWITYLLDKYGEDYKAMERDRKNLNQETWKQLRAKVKLFKGIPEQYEAYLKQKEQKEVGNSSA